MSGEAGAERVLDPKIAIFKVQPFLNQVEFGHAIFFVRALRRPLKQFKTGTIHPQEEQKNVVENGHGCCGIYSTPRFAVALVFGRGRTRYRGCWLGS